MKISLIFFENAQNTTGSNSYDFFLKASRFADENGFHRIWLPERHFHPFGGNYSSPVVLASALATCTTRIRIGAGSVVLPLHHPVRVAEEWAIVDNLSNGRVDVSFTKGWNPSENVFFPSKTPYSSLELLEKIELIKRLWKGESIEFDSGQEAPRQVQTYPRPLQGNIPIHLSTFDPSLFKTAAKNKYGVLTALLRQSKKELAEKIALYEEVFPPQHITEKHITLMLHTYIGESKGELLNTVEAPVRTYLKSSIHLWSQQSEQLQNLNHEQQSKILDFAVRRYIKKSGLFGIHDTAIENLIELQHMGVDEVACLIDFGVKEDKVIDSLKRLANIVKTIDRKEEYAGNK